MFTIENITLSQMSKSAKYSFLGKIFIDSFYGQGNIPQICIHRTFPIHILSFYSLPNSVVRRHRYIHTCFRSTEIICFTRIDFYINFLCLGSHVRMQSRRIVPVIHKHLSLWLTTSLR